MPAPPACAAPIDVPDISSVPPQGTVETTLTPGAKICDAVAELGDEAARSEASVAPTVTRAVVRAGAGARR